MELWIVGLLWFLVGVTVTALILRLAAVPLKRELVQLRHENAALRVELSIRQQTDAVKRRGSDMWRNG